MSLSFANVFCGCGLTAVAIYMLLVLTKLTKRDEDNGTVAFAMYVILVYSTCSALLHLVIATTERLVAILYPIRHKLFITKRRVQVSLLTVWVIAALLGLSPLFKHGSLENDQQFEHATTMIRFVFNIVSSMALAIGLLILLAYGIIIYKMVRGTNTEINRNRQLRHVNERKVIINSVALILCYIVTTIPSAVLNLWEIKTKYIRLWQSIIALRPLLDSLLYFFMNYCRRHWHVFVHDCLVSGIIKALLLV